MISALWIILWFLGINGTDLGWSSIIQLKPKLTSGRLESIENELRYLRDENSALKKEAAVREAKLQANIRSIKTFWSPELKKERNARKEEQLRAGL